MISYHIYIYWFKLLNTNEEKYIRNFYNCLNFELNNRIKFFLNTSEHTLHCCKNLTLILHELNLYIYISKLRYWLKLPNTNASYPFLLYLICIYLFSLFTMYIKASFFKFLFYCSFLFLIFTEAILFLIINLSS